MVRRCHRFAVRTAICALLSALSIAAPAHETNAPLAVLTVGGGPSKSYNQVAIESNVRYVDSLLPKSASKRILFADGNPNAINVRYTEPVDNLSSAEVAFRLMFEPDRAGGDDKYRPPRLRAIDGPALKPAIDAEFGRLRSAPAGTPYLLYFTGHGQRDDGGNLDNNAFNLWNNGTFSVRELTNQLQKLPADRPVVLVMVQCFGGAFGNVLFENGDPNSGVLSERPLCGFFATTRERVAAGCTPEVNEANYHDFTSYFFAALTGRDRLGKPVKATDFDGDGIIEMDEAFAYAESAETSIDVPVCTSDVFLRRFVRVDDDAIAATPFSQVRTWASLAQRSVLDRLSLDLSVSGENRLQTALAKVRADVEASQGGGHSAHENGGNGTAQAEARRALRRERMRLTEQFPALRSSTRSGGTISAEARKEAVAYLGVHSAEAEKILSLSRAAEDGYEAEYAEELRGARWLRLIRVAKTVVLEHQLREKGDKGLLARFVRLRALEHKNPLAL